MTTPSPYSAIIEEMRRQRRGLPSVDQIGDEQPVASRPTPEPEVLDPALQALERKLDFTRLFPNHDAAERRAVLLDVQTLLARCGYHWRLALQDKAMRNRRVVRRRAAARSTAKKPGRRRGAVNFAARQYGLGLAVIWWENTGRAPSSCEGRATGRPSYTDFVEAIATVATRRARQNQRGGMPSVDYLVREGVKDFRLARVTHEEYRRRGLVDERSWLHGHGADQD